MEGGPWPPLYCWSLRWSDNITNFQTIKGICVHCCWWWRLSKLRRYGGVNIRPRKVGLVNIRRRETGGYKSASFALKGGKWQVGLLSPTQGTHNWFYVHNLSKAFLWLYPIERFLPTITLEQLQCFEIQGQGLTSIPKTDSVFLEF